MDNEAIMDQVIEQSKKFVVQANKYLSVFESFDTQEEAIKRAGELFAEGYDLVNLRNNVDGSQEIW